MDNKEKKLLWAGRHVLTKEHIADLEQSAAINEFDKKMPRHKAEEEAHGQYIRGHHAKAAAYHLERSTACKAMGKMEEAKSHNAHYNMHLKAMGHDPYAPPPPEVKVHLGQPANNSYSFENHPADALIGHSLGKGEVIPFRRPEGPSRDLGQNAKVMQLPNRQPTKSPNLPNFFDSVQQEAASRLVPGGKDPMTGKPNSKHMDQVLRWHNGGNPLPICEHCHGKGQVLFMKCKHCGGQGLLPPINKGDLIQGKFPQHQKDPKAKGPSASVTPLKPRIDVSKMPKCACGEWAWDTNALSKLPGKWSEMKNYKDGILHTPESCKPSMPEW